MIVVDLIHVSGILLHVAISLTLDWLGLDVEYQHSSYLGMLYHTHFTLHFTRSLSTRVCKVLKCFLTSTVVNLHFDRIT